MPRVISKDHIPNLLVELKKSHAVFAPVKKGSEIIFDKVGDTSKIVLNYGTTLLPPKIYLLPAEEELFKVTGDRVQEAKIEKPFVLFGLSLKDLTAIAQLDQIMGKPPADTFYFNRRKAAILIGVSEVEVGVPPGGDLILEKIDDQDYRALALTQKGRKIAGLGLFQEKATTGKARSNGATTKLDQMVLDSELLAQAVEWSRENYPQIWETLGKTCFGCGICTYVCPLCYCTSTEDKTSFDRSVCTRCRKWDACTLPRFAQIAGGHNFRPSQKERYFNWFYHKFVRAYKEFGQVQCVACHRCQKYCPAGINIEKVLEEIITQFQKENPLRKT
jgi:sulfhydrogenase subunit beta (sulfur reductase)